MAREIFPNVNYPFSFPLWFIVERSWSPDFDLYLSPATNASRIVLIVHLGCASILEGKLSFSIFFFGEGPQKLSLSHLNVGQFIHFSFDSFLLKPHKQIDLYDIFSTWVKSLQAIVKSAK